MPAFVKNLISARVQERETRTLAVIELSDREADEHYSAFLKLEVSDAFCVQQKSNINEKMTTPNIIVMVKTWNKITVSDIGDQVS